MTDEELEQLLSLLLSASIVHHAAADPLFYGQIIILRPLYRRAKIEYRNPRAAPPQRFDKAIQQIILDTCRAVVIVELSLTANDVVLDTKSRIHTLRTSSANWQQPLTDYVHDWWEDDAFGPKALIAGGALELEIFEAAAALCQHRSAGG